MFNASSLKVGDDVAYCREDNISFGVVEKINGWGRISVKNTSSGLSLIFDKNGNERTESKYFGRYLIPFEFGKKRVEELNRQRKINAEYRNVLEILAGIKNGYGNAVGKIDEAGIEAITNFLQMVKKD
jgi:hypothetical protein